MKPPVQLLYRLRRLVLRLTRWKTRGVKVMLLNAKGELLLVRHSYHMSETFMLPGGGIRSAETPEAAAAREMREEIGIAPQRLEARSVHLSHAEGKRDTIHLFTAFTDEEPRADGVEVEEARFFPLDRLPERVSDATLRRIAEYRGDRQVETRW